MGEHDCVGGVMMTFGGVPFEAKRGSLRPDGPSGSGIRSAFIAATALSLFVVSGFSYADDRADDAGNAATAGRPAAAATEWPEIDATTSDDDDPAVVTASPSAPTKGQAEAMTPATEVTPPADEKLTADATELGKGGSDSDPETESPSSDDMVVQPFVVGVPDGATAPYVRWNVVDTAGASIPSATFSFERRGTNSWTGTRDVTDCTSGSCSVIDRDNDPAEYLVKWINSDTPGTSPSGSGPANVIQAGSRYQVRPVNPPSGYHWVSSTDWVDSNDLEWEGSGNDRTLDFGTFVVAKNNPTPTPFCTAGYVYGVSATGQMQQIAPGGAVTSLGNAASNVSSFNGLGIGSAGGPVYAYERTNDAQTVTMYSYNPATGAWANTNDTYDTTLVGNGGYSGSLVAGAINLSNDRYLFGGFQTTSEWVSTGRFTGYYQYTQVFKIWEYNPGATPRFSYKGYVETYSGTSQPGSANGDMAFDASGNLFVVRGSGATTTVFSVTAANLDAASGGQLSTSDSRSVTTMSNVNGVAFDASGKAYLGSSGEIRSYDMPGWSNATTVTSSGYSGTDLATCSSPPTIVIEKEVVGGRVDPDDQFTLSLSQGGTVLGEATTTGSAVGVQSERIGPVPTVRNVVLNFFEVGAGGADLANYASAHQCTVTHLDGTVQTLGQVNGTSGSITIPSSGDAVRCVFRNSPLVANVTVHKDVTDGAGDNPTPRQGWTVGATSGATTGSVSQVPTASTQTTSGSGDASWALTFGTYNDRATLSISEQMQDDYQFLSGQCVVTKLNGSQSTTTLSAPTSTAVTGIAPGDRVDCGYVNRPRPGTFSITKAFDATVPAGHGDVVFTGSYTCTLSGSIVASGTWSRTGAGAAVLTPDTGMPAANQTPVGASCSATETAPTGGAGLPTGYMWDTPVVGAAVTITGGGTESITVTNRAIAPARIYLTKSVQDVNGENPAPGSGWTVGAVLAGASSAGTTISPSGTQITGPNGGAPTPWTVAFAAPGSTANVTVSETQQTGYAFAAGSCTITPATGEPTTVALSATSHTLTGVRPGDSVACAFTNKPVPGAVTWQKVDGSSTAQHLAGSEWTISPVDLAGADIPVEDCVADIAAECANEVDTDHRAGHFRVSGLAWGDYHLVETKAPPGYQRDSAPHEFTIGPDMLTVSVGQIENSLREGPVLPLTGGFGRDHVYLAGALLLLLSLAGFGAKRLRAGRITRRA